MSAAERLVHALRDHGLTLAVAESLTGGAVCAAVVDVPGASAVLRGSVTAYDPAVKVAVLGIDAVAIARDGVVSRPIAAQMALGAARVLGADVALATTGVAGPGPSEGVEAGTVVVAAAIDGVVVTRRVVVAGSRATVRAAARDLVLALGLAVLTDGNTNHPHGVAHSDE